MAVTRNSRSIAMTAQSDAVTGKLKVASIQFNGTGLSAGEAITITETSGAAIFNGYVTATHENIECAPAEGACLDGITWSAKPATGTSRLLIRTE